MKSPQKQFHEDVSLVLMNDRASYESIMRKAEAVRNEEFAVVMLSDYIKNLYENAIANAMKQSAREWSASVGTLLISQICFGWGVSAFDTMARNILAELSESAGV